MKNPILTAALIILVTALPATAQDTGAVDFAKQIFPILEAKCLKCHQKERTEDGKLIKPKHGLRLDNAEGIMKGGKEYPNENVVAGKPDASWLLKTLSLPADDDLAMPPEGKADPVTDAEKPSSKPGSNRAPSSATGKASSSLLPAGAIPNGGRNHSSHRFL
jgi:hypothetical protein